MANPITILRDKAAWDAYCADGRASLATWTPPEYPCAVVVSWMAPAFFTVDHARTLIGLVALDNRGAKSLDTHYFRHVEKCDGDCNGPDNEPTCAGQWGNPHGHPRMARVVPNVNGGER